MLTLADLKIAPKNPGARLVDSGNFLIVLKLTKPNGKTVDELLAENPRYLLWVLQNVAQLSFSSQLIDKVLAAVNALNDEPQATPPPAPTFVVTSEDLERHAATLDNLSKGLDSYSNNGVRQVHGVPAEVNLHLSLDYFRKLAKHLITQDKKALPF